MKVLMRGKMPNGTDIQIEEWHRDYSFMPYGANIAAYSISQYTFHGAFAPKAGERYRFMFNFKNHGEAVAAFSRLETGSAKLLDYGSRLSHPEYIKCLREPQE